jgi:catechol 2,3-dioxygenase-like lactoylglutathione lyase family enzyme
LVRHTASQTVHVSDLDTSVRWYARVFGCEPLHRDTDTSLSGSSTEYAVFHLAGLKVFLSATRTEDEHQCQDEHHPPTLVFMTRHRLAQLRLELEERGALLRDDEVVDGFPVTQKGYAPAETRNSSGYTTPAETKWSSAGHSPELAVHRMSEAAPLSRRRTAHTSVPSDE